MKLIVKNTVSVKQKATLLVGEWLLKLNAPDIKKDADTFYFSG